MAGVAATCRNNPATQATQATPKSYRAVNGRACQRNTDDKASACTVLRDSICTHTLGCDKAIATQATQGQSYRCHRHYCVYCTVWRTPHCTDARTGLTPMAGLHSPSRPHPHPRTPGCPCTWSTFSHCQRSRPHLATTPAPTLHLGTCQTKRRVNIFITASGFETRFGWDRWARLGAGIRDSYHKHISNPDFAPKGSDNII